MLAVAVILLSAGARAIIGVMQARERLMAGWTTIRDIGNAGNYVDTDLRRAVEEGLVPGPTIINAGRIPHRRRRCMTDRAWIPIATITSARSTG